MYGSQTQSGHGFGQPNAGRGYQVKILGRASLASPAGIHGPPDPGTDRSESVQDFQNFVGPGPVPSFEIFSVLVRFGPRYRIFSWTGP